MIEPQKRQTPPDRAGFDTTTQTEGNRLQVHRTHSADDAQASIATHEAERFLAVLDESGDAFCFRTFPDDKSGGGGRNYAGSFASVASDLQADNDNGRGVFVIINDGGQKDSDTVRVRAVFADFDKNQPPDHIGIEPHIVVESSRSKYHFYWLVDGLDVSQFKPLQKRIAARFGSDPSVCNPARVMRLPGFLHRKPADNEGHDGKPFQTHIIRESGALPYAAETVLAAFPEVSKAPAPPSAPQGAGTPVEVSTERHDDMLKLSGKLARQIHYEGMSRAAALAALEAEEMRGRWSRDMRPGEMAEALDGALVKLSNGEWPNDRNREDAQDDPDVELEPPMHIIELGDLTTASVKPPTFVMEPWLPRGHTTLFGAHGGAGKSTFALEIAAHVAAGRPLGPYQCEQGRALIVSLEDDGDLVRYRLAGICKAFDLDPAEIAANVTLLDGAAVDASLAVESSVEFGIKSLRGTDALAQVRDLAPGHDLIVIDNASDGFAGNGNDALQVRRFVKRMLGRIAHDTNAAVLLLAHLDKAAARYGSQGQSFIGSVAWHNSARSRVALIEHDGQLSLYHEKANLSRKAEPLPLRWTDDGVLMPAAGSDVDAQSMASLFVESDAEDVLTAIQAAHDSETSITVARTGPSTTRHVLETFGLAKALRGKRGKDRFWVAVEHLRQSGQIVQEGFTDRYRNKRQRFVPCPNASIEAENVRS